MLKSKFGSQNNRQNSNFPPRKSKIFTNFSDLVILEIQISVYFWREIWILTVILRPKTLTSVPYFNGLFLNIMALVFLWKVKDDYGRKLGKIRGKWKVQLLISIIQRPYFSSSTLHQEMALVSKPLPFYTSPDPELSNKIHYVNFDFSHSRKIIKMYRFFLYILKYKTLNYDSLWWWWSLMGLDRKGDDRERGWAFK